MITVGGDAYIAPRANVGIGPYEHRINRPINRNLYPLDERGENR